MKYIVKSIIDSKLKGLKTHQLNSENLKCFTIPRNLIKHLSDIEDCSNSGIYFLVNSTEHSLYVGQTDNLASRLADHNRTKDFDMAIALTTETNSFSKTHIDYLEYWYISEIKKQNYWNLVNLDERNRKPNINEYDEIELNDIIKNIDILLSFLDISFDDIKLTTETEFYFKQAKAIYSNGEFIILKGSILHNFSDSLLENLDKDHKSHEFQKISIMRSLIVEEELKKQNKLKIINDNQLEALADIKVNSPSEGAKLVYGSHSRNGWTDWKNKDRKTLDDVYRK